MFKIFRKHTKVTEPAAPEKMFQVTYCMITSKGESGPDETEVMPESEYRELARCLYCDILEAWEL